MTKTQSMKKSLETINHNSTHLLTKMDKLIEINENQIKVYNANTWKLIFALLALLGAVLGARALG